MKAFGTRMRGGLATMLSVALIVSGALLAAPSASAEELTPQSEAAAVTAPVEVPVEEAPADEAPAEVPALDAPVSDAPIDAPAAEAPVADELAGTVPSIANALPVSASVATTILEASAAGLNLKFDFSEVPASTLRPPQNSGLYVALVEAGTILPLGSGQFVPNASITNGSGSGSYVVAAVDLDRGKSYEAMAWYAHGDPTDESIVARSAVTVTAAQWDAVFPKVWTPALTSVALADGTPIAAGDTVYKGDTIVVTGTGFDPEANVGGRGMPIPANLPQGSYVVFSHFGQEWQPSGGAANSANRVQNNSSQGWVLSKSVLDQVPAMYKPSIEKQWIQLADEGSWTAELTLTTPSKTIDGGDYGVYTYGAGGVDNAAQELKFELMYEDTERPKAWTPALTSVALADGTPIAAGDTVYKGDTIIVTGTGFDPEANIGGRGRPIPANLPQGSYVVFGKFAEAWQPSSGALSSTRKAGPQAWVLAESVLDQVPPEFQGTIRKQWAELETDGSFQAELTIADPEGADSVTGSYGVFAYGAGGVNNAAQELELRLNYVDSERPVSGEFAPDLKVFLADGTTPYTDQALKEGDELVVKGSGFDPFANLGGIGQPIPADKPQGTFVVFGKFADDWKPSDKATSDKRTMNAANRGWLLAESTLENDVPALHREEIRTQWVELDEATGSFSWTVKLTEPSSPLASGNWGIYTYAGGVNTSNAAQELSVPLNYTAKATTDPEGPGDAVGALQWGIYSNFRNYVESNPDGRVETLGAATRTGDIFGFTQTTGGAWDAKSETGELRFSGGVAFFAHGDALSLTIENPILQVSESGAVLTARFDHGPQTPFADVDLSAANRSVAADGAVTWTGATTKMRKEGVAKFLDFYPAGTQLDPLTFTAGAAAETPNTPVVEISGVNVVAEQGLKVDVAATGLPGAIYAALIERGTGSNLDMGDPSSYAAFALPFPKVTDGAANFSLVAPLDKLDRKKQYEVLVWKIHSLPNAGTTYGHANVEVTKAQWDELEGVKPPVEEPVVTPKPKAPGAGSLTWGISTPFADYVTGNIAKGTIATNGVGGGRGGYVFPQATGSSWNAETRTGTVYYSGSVTFIGHGGLLRETFANPVITVNSPISGTISASGRSFPMNLASAGFSANADGSATWSNVSVSGVISGGDGGGSGGTLAVDSLSFTVGSPSGLNFGSTNTTSKHAATRTAAATPPSSTGLTVVTPAAKLVAGGEIEITAGGFEPNEQGILVVIYSEPTLLDSNAKADKNGVVRWIGKLPKNLTGKHTITLQGSINVGQEITIAAADSLTKAKKAVAAPAVASELQNTNALPNTGTPAWVWWAGALTLLIAAGATTGLVVTQRRKNAVADLL